jgi:hypothetical protein
MFQENLVFGSKLNQYCNPNNIIFTSPFGCIRKNNTLTPRQLMVSPDVLAYELGQIPTPEKIENTKIATYVLFGVFVTITIGLISYTVYKIRLEKK